MVSIIKLLKRIKIFAFLSALLIEYALHKFYPIGDLFIGTTVTDKNGGEGFSPP